MIKKARAALTNLVRLITNSEAEDPRIINRDIKEAIEISPWVRKELRDVSILEDEQNSYYSGMLTTLSEHCVGSIPLLLGNHPVDTVNDDVEDRWKDWCIENGIGSVIRQVRRGAARTGIGIAVPYNKKRDILGLGFKSVCSSKLQNPPTASWDDRIVDGIEYDENWDPVKIYIESDDPWNPTPYDIDDIIFWHKQMHEGMIFGLPECYPAFCLFPSVKRFIEAIVKAEEFRAAIPMAVELDPDFYTNNDVQGVPKGTMTYKPGTIPTLPPGTKLSGLPISISGAERQQFVKLVIGAAARCLQMPTNLAMGDSSNHNMATAAIDIQPWITKIKIDRNDFEPVIRKMFKMWHTRATLVSGYLPVQARSNFTYDLNYDATFEHPDPGKRANARAIDLASGASTLHEIYTEKGKNPRRHLNREAKELGISRDELNQLIISRRVQVGDIAKLLFDQEEEHEEE